MNNYKHIGTFVNHDPEIIKYRRQFETLKNLLRRNDKRILKAKMSEIEIKNINNLLSSLRKTIDKKVELLKIEYRKNKLK